MTFSETFEVGDIFVAESLERDMTIAGKIREVDRDRRVPAFWADVTYNGGSARLMFVAENSQIGATALMVSNDEVKEQVLESFGVKRHD